MSQRTARSRDLDTEDGPTPAEPDTRGLLAGRYRMIRTIGVGGQASVHRAVHAHLDLPVAIKVFHLDGFSPADSQATSRRFLREARMAARARHRNVLAVHDTGQTPDGSPFLVMELIEGEDLAERISRGPLGIPGVIDLGRQLFAALAAIDAAGLLHRDVKPANVMLHAEPDGDMLVKLVDFGIARERFDADRLTALGAIVGTPHYMPPEQLRREDLDTRADLYAACAVLYEATTGEPPFDGESAAVVVSSVLSATLRPVRTLRAECPAALAGLIERGLSRDRRDRPPDPRAMIAALERITREEHVPTGALAWSDDQARGTTPKATPRAPADSPSPPAPRARASSSSAAPVRAWLARAAVSLGVLSLVAVALPRPAPPPSTRAATQQPSPLATEQPSPAPAPTIVVEGSSVDELLDDGLAALARGEVEAALGHYRAAALAAPERAEPHRGRGIAAARAGLDDEAIRALERYLMLAPDAPDAAAVRARVESQRRRRSERLASISYAGG